MSETIAKRPPVNPLAGAGDYFTVMSYGAYDTKCAGCGKVGLVFSCHDARARSEGGKVIDRCKPCAVLYARERKLAVHLKSCSPTLVPTWHNNRRCDLTDAQKAGKATAARKRREKRLLQD